MRLADFIDANLSPILGEWEAFAATLLPAAAGLDALALRDHATQILQAVASDLRTHTGPTIPQNLAKAMFEPLRRRDASELAAERESMGLGLFIVRQIAVAHGGAVALESADGVTRFTVTLPRVRPPSHEEPRDGPAPSQG